MKKAAMFVLAFVFLLGATCAIAKGTNENKDFSKPLPVSNKDVKLEAKKVLSKKEIKSIENMEAMGKSGGSTGGGTTTTTGNAATGFLGKDLPTGAHKYAIVIGLANYPGVSTTTTDALLPDLCVQPVPDNIPSYSEPDGTISYDDLVKNNCKDGDSVNMEQALLGTYNFDYVFLLSDSKATFANIKQAKDDLLNGWTDENGNYHSALTANDEVVFFFSGHGVMSTYDIDTDGEAADTGIVVYDQNYNETLYKDATKPYIDPITGNSYQNYAAYYGAFGYDSSAYIWDGQIADWFKDVPTTRILFAFDTCHAGGMADDLAAPGREVAMAAQENQSANTFYLGGADNSGNIHDSEGLFTHYFVLRGMHDGFADGYNALKKSSTNPSKYDGRVAAEEAFQYAKSIVFTEQTPVLNDQFVNDLYLDFQN